MDETLRQRSKSMSALPTAVCATRTRPGRLQSRIEAAIAGTEELKLLRENQFRLFEEAKLMLSPKGGHRRRCYSQGSSTMEQKRMSTQRLHRARRGGYYEAGDFKYQHTKSHELPPNDRVRKAEDVNRHQLMERGDSLVTPQVHLIQGEFRRRCSSLSQMKTKLKPVGEESERPLENRGKSGIAHPSLALCVSTMRTRASSFSSDGIRKPQRTVVPIACGETAPRPISSLTSSTSIDSDGDVFERKPSDLSDGNVEFRKRSQSFTNYRTQQAAQQTRSSLSPQHSDTVKLIDTCSMSLPLSTMRPRSRKEFCVETNPNDVEPKGKEAVAAKHRTSSVGSSANGSQQKVLRDCYRKDADINIVKKHGEFPTKTAGTAFHNLRPIEIVNMCLSVTRNRTNNASERKLGIANAQATPNISRAKNVEDKMPPSCQGYNEQRTNEHSVEDDKSSKGSSAQKADDDKFFQSSFVRARTFSGSRLTFKFPSPLHAVMLHCTDIVVTTGPPEAESVAKDCLADSGSTCSAKSYSETNNNSISCEDFAMDTHARCKIDFSSLPSSPRMHRLNCGKNEPRWQDNCGDCQRNAKPKLCYKKEFLDSPDTLI